VKKRRRSTRTPSVVAAVLGCASILATAAVPAAASTTLVLKEPKKGSTYAFVDNPPKSPKKVHGIPLRLSPGDEMTFAGPIEMEGKIVGRMRGVCTATQSASARNADAGFICTALAKIPGGSLVLVGPPDAGDGSKPAAEGAVVGGTGKYAGARGTFAVEEGWTSDTNTITLLE
jgi:hypothetical protein